jgi:hypothetical protein
VTLSNSLTTIESSAFSNCSNLTTLDIPGSVTTIGGYAFKDCSSLTTLTLPDSLTTIGGYAFKDCSSLTDVTVGWKTPLSIEDNVFDNAPFTAVTLHAPPGTKALYRAANGWKMFRIIDH